jgi:4-hydroxy-tetrahydrodipicolinate synthase
MSSREFTGVLFYPITPFDETGDLDEDRFRRLLTRVADEAAIGGVTPLGSTGEFPYLSIEERKRATEVAIDAVGDRLPVVVGTSAISTRQAVDLATHAESAGADGVLVNPQSYYPLQPDEIHAHYRAIDEAIGIPLIAYNNPGTTGIDMSLNLVRRIAALDNVTQFKASSGDLEFFTRLVLELGDEVSLLCGSNPLAFETVSLGAVGWTTGVANVAPERCVDLFRALEGGDPERARSTFLELYPLLEFLTNKRLSVAIKAALEIQGRPAGDPRPPLRPLPEDDRSRLKAILGSLDLL